MPKGSSRPSINYNATRNRWEIAGKGGTTRFAVDDSGTPVVKFLSFVGSSAAIANTGSLMLTGTITGGTGLSVGDKVFASPKVALASAVVVGFHIPTTNTLNFYALSPNAVGSFAARGWDVFAIKTE